LTVFEQVKSAIDMRTVAEGYGLEISRGGMALCPFHNERTPSAKIYPDALHCFGCGTHVDVIDFTQKMFGLDKPIDAVKKLNYDYDLHIEIGKTPTAEEVSEYQKRVAEKRAYEE
jgi:DNA primase